MLFSCDQIKRFGKCARLSKMIKLLFYFLYARKRAHLKISLSMGQSKVIPVNGPDRAPMLLPPLVSYSGSSFLCSGLQVSLANSLRNCQECVIG